MPVRVSSTCAHHQEVKIALHSLWYHHTETSEWSKITKTQFYKYEQILVKFISIDSLQKTAILGTAHIIRKVLQCEA